MYKFYICPHCGNIVTMAKDAGVPVMCCGQKMQELVAGTVEASLEKHVPIYTIENGVINVMVGELEHPMIPEHFIEFIAVETNKDLKMTRLTDLDNPEASFAILPDETVVAVYAYCNLHGLWKA